MLSERQNRVQLEAQQLREERDEMLVQFKELDAAMRAGARGEHGDSTWAMGMGRGLRGRVSMEI